MTHSYLESARDNVKSLPISIFAPNQTKIQSNSGEMILSDYKNFDYQLNQYGLRYDIPNSDNILLASGCSITFGQGLAKEDIYCEIVSKELGLECVNVALPGTGPDIQIANSYWALQKYKPKIFLLYISDTERKPLASEYGYQTLNPNWENDIFQSSLEKKLWTMVSQKFEWSRYLQIAWSMYPLVEYCKEHNIQFYWKCWAGLPDSQLRKFDWLINTNDLGNMKGIDKARDGMHSGIESHKEFARRILNVIKV